MIKRFKRYLNKIFIFCPKTAEIYEFKEELLGILMEKYAELRESGMGEEESYAQCILSIDDYRDTIKELEQKKYTDPKNRLKGMYLLTSLAYLAAVLIVYFAVSFATAKWGITWLTFIIGAVVYLIFLFALLYRWARKRSYYATVRIMIMLLILLSTILVFLIVSISTRKWSLTWLTFPGGVIVWMTVDTLYRIRRKKKISDGDVMILGTAVTLAVYLAVSLSIGYWQFTWLALFAGMFLTCIALIIKRYLYYTKSQREKIQTSAYQPDAEEIEKIKKSWEEDDLGEEEITVEETQELSVEKNEVDESAESVSEDPNNGE